MLALHYSTGWRFFTPRPGWRTVVLPENGTVFFDGAAWIEEQLDHDNFAGVGIGTGSDATNRLTVAFPAIRLTHMCGALSSR